MRKIARIFAATLLNNVEVTCAFEEAQNNGIVTEDDMREIEYELNSIINKVADQIGPADTYEMTKQVVKGEI